MCTGMLCRLAEQFTKPNFYDPLVAGNDPLAGFHANTHLAQVRYLHLRIHIYHPGAEIAVSGLASGCTALCRC